MIVAKVSYFTFNLFHTNKNNKSSTVVVGMETASCLKNISCALDGSISVNFAPSKYYSFEYTYKIYSNTPIKKLYNLLYSPILFGYLLSRHERFIYLGAIGFLKPFKDGREQEFKFLKSKSKQLVCYFMGSEIRSFELLNNFARERDIDVITTYQGISHKGIDSLKNENIRKTLGKTADKYADIIFNPSTDQIAYIKKKSFPFIYFVEPSLFETSQKKLNKLEEIIVLHCPTSPTIKGTPLVRAAIKKLKMEGYTFKYIELINEPHETVLHALKTAHIVLNQFYSFVPGVFGIEAMANSCALLTSADENIETTLDEGANEAWKVTPYWLVYDNLKLFLDNPDLIKPQAIAGHNWAKKHCTYAAGAKKMNDIIND